MDVITNTATASISGTPSGYYQAHPGSDAKKKTIIGSVVGSIVGLLAAIGGLVAWRKRKVAQVSPIAAAGAGAGTGGAASPNSSAGFISRTPPSVDIEMPILPESVDDAKVDDNAKVWAAPRSSSLRRMPISNAADEYIENLDTERNAEEEIRPPSSTIKKGNVNRDPGWEKSYMMAPKSK